MKRGIILLFFIVGIWLNANAQNTWEKVLHRHTFGSTAWSIVNMDSQYVVGAIS